MDLRALESELMKLSQKEKALIAYKLLKEIEDVESDEIEEVLINESLQRKSKVTGEQKKLILDSYKLSESDNNLISHKAVISRIRDEL